MAAYDKLPAALRQALRDSGEQFSAAQMFELLRKGKASCSELIDMIKQEDKWR